jgi:two-component system response regulator NreC
MLLAVGARRHERFPHAITLDDRCLDDQLHGPVADVEQGYAKSVAFLVPPRVPWPLPVYELALMIAERAHDMNVELGVSIVTPERAPLEALGEQASLALAARLSTLGIKLYHSEHGEVVAPRRVRLPTRGIELDAERLVALPELFGPSIGGVPRGAPGGFIRVDRHGGVIGPNGSSIETISRLRERVPETEIVVLTMEESPLFARRALDAGAIGFVLKHHADSELPLAVRAAGRGCQYVSPRVAAGLAALNRMAATDELSPREVEVLRLIALGHTSAEIAAQLHRSRRTVETHRAHIHRKLGLATRAELVRYALDRRLIGASGTIRRVIDLSPRPARRAAQ